MNMERPYATYWIRMVVISYDVEKVITIYGIARLAIEVLRSMGKSIFGTRRTMY